MSMKQNIAPIYFNYFHPAQGDIDYLYSFINKLFLYIQPKNWVLQELKSVFTQKVKVLKFVQRNYYGG